MFNGKKNGQKVSAKIKSEKKVNADYYEEAKSWETQRVMGLIDSAKNSKRVAIGACVVAVAACLAVASLAPLKTVEPFVVRVNDNTGSVDIIKSMHEGKTNYEESINKYFTQQYVKFRESFTKDLAEDYYNNVGVMSNESEQARYAAWFSPKSPTSPLNTYGDIKKAKVKINSTSFINDNVALVRFTRFVELPSNIEQTNWAATITFSYVNSSMTETDRGINPLGFQVSDYRVDPDGQSINGTALVTVLEKPKPVSVSQNKEEVTILPPADLGETPVNNNHAVPAIQ